MTNCQLYFEIITKSCILFSKNINKIAKKYIYKAENYGEKYKSPNELVLNDQKK